jgi:two-component system sensor histidine kinase/response regulator
MDIKQNILIVDDNLKNLQVAAKVLKDNGYSISLAQDGPSAIKMVEEEAPDLILMDVMMPEMDGMEASRQIRRNKDLKDIPIIFLTARNQTEDIVEGFKAGGVDYITKPFNKDELLIRIKNHLELAFARKKIIELNRNRDKLYSIIAHDVRSPLSSILFMIGAIKSNLITPGTDDYQEMLESIEKTTSETSTLLNNLLSWAKVQSQAVALTPKITNICNVLNECVSLLKANAELKNIALASDVPEGTSAYFDEVTMHTVFRNVISNAIKFTPLNGSVNVSSFIDQGMVTLVFKDNGLGIPEHVVEKIMIHNQHHTTPGTANEQGSGLGLVMVKDFISSNNGKLNIKSKEGEGTEIWISLPLDKTEQN